MLPSEASVLPGEPSVLPGEASVLPGEPSVLPGEASVLPGEPSVLPGEASMQERAEWGREEGMTPDELNSGAMDGEEPGIQIHGPVRGCRLRTPLPCSEAFHRDSRQRGLGDTRPRHALRPSPVHLRRHRCQQGSARTSAFASDRAGLGCQLLTLQLLADRPGLGRGRATAGSRRLSPKGRAVGSPGPGSPCWAGRHFLLQVSETKKPLGGSGGVGGCDCGPGVRPTQGDSILGGGGHAWASTRVPATTGGFRCAVSAGAAA